jgi:hypothetical protein
MATGFSFVMSVYPSVLRHGNDSVDTGRLYIKFYVGRLSRKFADTFHSLLKSDE